MADDILVENQPQQPAVSPEVARMMELSLSMGTAPDNSQNGGEGGSGGSPVVVNENEPVVAPDVFAPFKEKFGYQSPEDAIREIEELRGFKANPTPAELKFENEQSERIFKALKEGKQSEVYQFLEQQQKLESLTSAEVNKDTAAEIIKLGMRLRYNDLTQAEIDYKFNKQYAIPKEPVQTDLETDEDFSARKEEWQEKVADIEMSRIIDAKLAKPELESAKSKIVLPDINANVDEGYAQYLKDLEDQPKRDAEVAEAYKALTPKAIETKMPFTDEANKIAFEFQYEPDSESFNKSVGMATNISEFFNSFVTPDGKPDRQKFLKVMHFAMNQEAVIMEAMKQAKNATIKSFLPDNSQPGGQRMSPQTQEPSELDKQMQVALGPYQRR